ncbi:endonuclease/exonuclease/phosphatase family protein [Pseudonocardia acidicola]|uniref:Endonuclease/exonuclease/phosphatase family protein n=1 Tax=Pseudonocardia acidicola TaxID=2724939 RepID=A0ABX1SLI7_9PSEU|nr:endonuclease/exonuclease/phosphatase family protein [Pseudonocardia acidicola]NMI01282.1 endonuclease/exonuclease/phosphatase family protein [Pseudonocardia acidicola]
MSAPPGPARPGAAQPPVHPPPGRSPRGGRGRFLAAGLLTAVAAAGVLPDLLFRMDRYSPFAQLIAFRPLLLAADMMLAAIAVLITCVRRRAWPFAAGLVAIALVGGAMVLPRAVADPLPTSGRPLTVLSFNVFEGNADVDAVAELIRSERPDLVSLPESGAAYRDRLAPLVEPLGYRLTTSIRSGRADVAGVTAVVADGLGDVTVRIGAEMPFPYVEVTGGGLGALRFVAFHSVAPVPGEVPQWRADLGQLAQWCENPRPAIVAGDLNATLDHSALRGAISACNDAAAQRGAGLAATWPTSAPHWLGPQIDHVLSNSGIAAETFSVRDIPGSDHRAIVTRLRIPG